MIKLTQLKSTNIRAAGQDPATNLLAVHFHSGAVWHYKDVPPKLAGQLLEASSPGKFFNENIVGQYPAEQVVEPEKLQA